MAAKMDAQREVVLQDINQGLEMQAAPGNHSRNALVAGRYESYLCSFGTLIKEVFELPTQATHEEMEIGEARNELILGSYACIERLATFRPEDVHMKMRCPELASEVFQVK